MNFTKTLLAAAALTASVGANAVVTGSTGGGFGPFLTITASPAPTPATGTACTAPNTCTIGPVVGNVSGGTIYSTDRTTADIPFGSSSFFLAAGPSSGLSSTVTLGATNYVSFLWGSPDTYNLLRVTDSSGTSTFTTATLGFSQSGGNQSFSQYVQFIGAGITSLQFTNSSSIDAFEATNFSITPIPEPETYALMLAGLAALGFVSKRRKQA